MKYTLEDFRKELIALLQKGEEFFSIDEVEKIAKETLETFCEGK